MEFNVNKVIDQIRQDINDGKVVSKVDAGYRYYVDATNPERKVVITNNEDTARAYYTVFIKKESTPTDINTDAFDKLSRVSMYIGAPDTGKTTHAINVCKECGVTPLFKMCRDTLNLETLLEDFILVEGKPAFQESLAIKLMTGTEKGIIILDEFNTLLTGVMKTFQPIFDDTSTHFEYRGKQYKKNMNCKWIVTLNHNDKGISVIPDAILSRSYLQWFKPVSDQTIHIWTGIDVETITKIREVFKRLNIEDIFGTRQVKIINNIKNMTELKNHLYGLCVMKKTDPKILDLLEGQDILQRLAN